MISVRWNTNDLFGQKWDHQYSLKGCKGSNIQDSALLGDGDPDIQDSVQFGHELMFPSKKLKNKKKEGSVRIDFIVIMVLFLLTKMCVKKYDDQNLQLKILPCVNNNDE